MANELTVVVGILAICSVGCSPQSSNTSPKTGPTTFAYVSNQRDNTISGYVVSASGTFAVLPPSPFETGTGPAGLAVDPSGKFLYVANVLSDNVSGYAIASDGSLSQIAGSPFPAASGAVSVAIDPTGKFLYVPSCGADCSGSGPGAIAAFSITPGTGALVPAPGSPFTAGTYPYEMAFYTQALPAHLPMSPTAVRIIFRVSSLNPTEHCQLFLDRRSRREHSRWRWPSTRHLVRFLQ